MIDLIPVALIVAAVVLFLLWLLLIKIWEFLVSLWNLLTGETARKKRREEEAQQEEEERQLRQQERQRKRQQEAAEERKRFRTENADVFDAIAALRSTCMEPAAEMMRAAKAFVGESCEVLPEFVVWTDLGNILASFSPFVNEGDTYIETLWKEINGTIQLSHVKDVPPLSGLPNRGVKEPAIVGILAEYDKHGGTILSSRAASTYLSVVSAVSSHCDGSLPPKIISEAYRGLLNPYVKATDRSENAGRSASSGGNQSSGKSDCEECVKGYQLLDLPFGASKDEVKQKRDALAQVLHSDHTGGMSERIRDTAEEQLKSIIAAYNHIRKCRYSGTNGSEPLPDSNQTAANTKAAGEKTEHEPSSASSSTEGIELQKHAHTVRSTQDLIDAIDATSQKMEESARRLQKSARQLLESLERLKNRV